MGIGITPPELAAWEAVARYLLSSWLVQATLLLGAGLLLARLPRLGPAQRHGVLATALFLATLSPVALLLPLPYRATVPAPRELRVVGRPLRAAGSRPALGVRTAAGATTLRPGKARLPVAPALAPALAWLQQYPALALAAGWLLLVALKGALLGVSALQVSTWRRGGRPLDRDRLYRACGYRLADIPILETRGVGVPSVIGVRRPTILLPADLAGEVDDATLGQILLHEEGHVRRRDPLLRLLAALAGLLLFWHPLAAWVRRRMEQAAEDACDLHVLRRGTDRAAYARTLLSVLELALTGRSRGLACRLGRTGGELRRRVSHILTHPTTASPAMTGLAALAAVPVVGAALLLDAGPRPTFRYTARSASNSPVSTLHRRTSTLHSLPAALPSSTLHAPPSTLPPPRSPLHSPPNPLPPPLPILGGREPVAVLAAPRASEPRADHLTVFVLDISSSMAAYQQDARRQLLLRLEALPPGDRFNVVAFNSRVLPYASSPVSPTPETLASVREWLNALPAETGTNLVAGLEHALAQEEVTSVVLFSEDNLLREIGAAPEFLAVVERANRFHARVLAVAPEGLPAEAGQSAFTSLPEPAQQRAQANQRQGEAELP